MRPFGEPRWRHAGYLVLLGGKVANMRTKDLHGVANNLCQMAVGPRILDDMDTLAELPDGTIEIDLVSRVASHSSAGLVQLRITSELADWLCLRLGELAIPTLMLKRAHVKLAYRTDRVPTNRKTLVSFDLKSSGALATPQLAARAEF